MKKSDASGSATAMSRSVSTAYVGPPRSTSTLDTANASLSVDRELRHRNAVLGVGDDPRLFLPRLSGRDEQDAVEREALSHLFGGDEMSVVDGIERPTHHTDAIAQANLSMNPASCLRFRHSWIASQCSAYAEITESPVSQCCGASGFSHHTRFARSWRSFTTHASGLR